MTDLVSIDRYSQFVPIGSGGFSQVYKAFRADQDRSVAVKVLALGSSREIDRDAFSAECRAMGAVSSHPNVVTAFDNGFTNEGYPFIAMELCQESLAERIRSAPDHRLDADEVLTIGAKIFSALERAHDKGILHRDLKPQNIMFTEWGEPALTDFGIAALAGDDRTQQSWALSRHYAAPEVINDEPHTISCDIYSLGATLYTALAGHRPFARPSANDPELVEQRIRSESPPPLDPDWVPDFVADEILRCLAKHSSDRPSSAREASQRLLRLQERLGHQRAAIADTTTSRERDITQERRDPVDDPLADDLTSSTATARRSAASSDDEAPPGSTGSRAGFAAVVLLAVLAVVVAAVLASRASGDAPGGPVVAPTAIPVAPDDATVTDLSAPPRPGGVTIEAGTNGAIISWRAIDDAESYRVDFAGDRRSMLVDEARVVVPRADGEIVCVEVVAINDVGRPSLRSTQACG